MALNKNRLVIIFLAIFAASVLAACSSPADPTPTATPQPTATPTPEAVQAINIDPEKDPAGFLAALPKGEVDCATSAVGGIDVLTKVVASGGDSDVDLSDTQLKVLASCISGETVQKIFVGQLELNTGGLSASTSACVLLHASGIDFATLFTGQSVEQDTIVSILQTVFCLNAEERRALESSSQDFVQFGDLGGIDALECAVDGAGPNGLQQFGEMFSADGEVDPVAVGQFMPLLIDCGVINEEALAESGITADQFSCLFERLDPETLDSFLSISDDPNATPDLASAASLLTVMSECGLDLQSMIDSSSSSGGLPGEPTMGITVSSELLICLTDSGVSTSIVADYAAGLLDPTNPQIATALAVCAESTSSGGFEVPGDGTTTIDPTVLDGLPVTPEQAQCLIDEVGLEQIEGIADGSTSPLAILGALSTCNIDIADLISG